MDRAEVVAALREAYETGGMPMLAAIADDIREHGPIHDPDWVLCVDCGTEFEPDPMKNNDTRRPLRCPTCHDAHKVAQGARYRSKENR